MNPLIRNIKYYIPLVPRMGTQYVAANPADVWLTKKSPLPDVDHLRVQRNHANVCEKLNGKRIIPDEESEKHMSYGVLVRCAFWFGTSKLHLIPSAFVLSFYDYDFLLTEPAFIGCLVAFLANPYAYRRSSLVSSRMKVLEGINRKN